MLGNSNRASEYNRQLLALEKEIGKQNRVTVSDIENFNFTPLNSTRETQLGKLQSSLSDLQNTKAPELISRIGSYISCKQSSKPERCNLSDIGLSTSNNDYVNNQDNIEFTKLRIREIETKQRDGDELGSLGISTFAMGNYEKAIEYQLKWLAAAEEIKDNRVKEVALTNLGIAYRNLGKYDTAINYLLQGLILARENKDKLRELKILGNLAIVFRELHKYDEVIKYIRQGIELTRETGDKESDFTALVNVRISFYSLCNYLKNQSLDYLKLRNYDKTIEYGLQHLEIAREIKDKQSEGEALDNLSVAYSFVNNYDKAIDYAQQRLVIAREIQDRQGEAIAFNNLGLALDRKNQLELAIFFYKQSINIRETIRQDLRELSKEDQKAYLDTVSGSYRRLADLLLKQNRILEAQEVLELLKVQEIREFTRSSSISRQNTGITTSPTETLVLKKYGTLIAFGLTLDRCQQSQCSQISELLDQRDQITKEFYQLVRQLENEIRSRSANDTDSFDLSKLGGKAEAIVTSQPNSVLIYTLVLSDRLWIIWAAKGRIIKTTEVPNVGREQLREKIVKLRILLSSPNSDIKELKATAKQLYDWLIPVSLVSELKQNKIQTLIFSLDSVIRYIPMSALFDGDKYLVETYNISTILSADLTDTQDRLPKEMQKVSVLAVGVSEDAKKNFSALPYVPQELKAIAREDQENSQGVYSGKILLNREFTARSLRDNLSKFRYNIVHIATHGEFKPTDKDSSFLLMGTGDWLYITDIKLRFSGLLNQVHLVVLSACKTALGETGQDGKEVIGISSYFLQGGAKAVIASLWSVNDASTSQLMQLFYNNLATGKMTKTEALREAQLAIINVGDRVSDVLRDLVVIENRLPQNSQPVSKGNLSHPYYWAPFILIGNGL